ncbi:unnamed protein product [Pleuronectes platessa]|uniref:CRAL-TRIO domain-containing protein n=1 Tax=Pleuronectes platessa TaxID=8262 RepID=A0A9N7UR31_PLEPL|nr:unnamed protein product [Pleuronectes platessa]
MCSVISVSLDQRGLVFSGPVTPTAGADASLYLEDDFFCLCSAKPLNIRDSFPARFGGIHFVNQPWYIHALYTVIRPFLKDKTRKRIFMHGNNLNSLHLLIHPEILPSELGGMMPPYDMGTWARALLDHAYDEETDYCPESYTLSVQDLERDLEKDLSPKTMKRSQSVVEPGVLKRPDKVKSGEDNMQPLLSLD